MSCLCSIHVHLSVPIEEATATRAKMDEREVGEVRKTNPAAGMMSVWHRGVPRRARHRRRRVIMLENTVQIGSELLVKSETNRLLERHRFANSALN